MEHPIRKSTIRFTLAEPFDYLSAGEVYRGTPYNNGFGARIDRDDESSGTFLQKWQWARLLDGAAGFKRV